MWVSARSLTPSVSNGAGAIIDLFGAAKSFTSTFQRYNLVDGGSILLQGGLDPEHFFTIGEFVIDANLESFTVWTVDDNEHAFRYIRHYAQVLTGSNPGFESYLVAHPII